MIRDGMNVTLLGTSHISPKSAARVREEVLSGKYDIIAVELDKARLEQLFSKDAKQASFFSLVRAVGVSGAVFAKLGHWVQKKLGGRIGMEPGEEMRQAVRAAAQTEKKIALIDQPIHVTLAKFSSAFTFREKLRVLMSVFRFKKLKIHLSEEPDEAFVQAAIEELEAVSPALARVLVHERNTYMCKKLNGLEKRFPEARILAVVGAGHVPGMTECLNSSVKEKDV